MTTQRKLSKTKLLRELLAFLLLLVTVPNKSIALLSSTKTAKLPSRMAWHSSLPFTSQFTTKRNDFKPNISANAVSLRHLTYPCTLSSTNLKGISVFVGLAILSGYHIKLLHGEKSGSKTWRSAQADTREQWSRLVRETEGWLYAVQTLWNAITANTFLATTVLSLLTLIAGRVWEIVRNAEPSFGRRYLVSRFVLVASCMLTSAYEFLQSARLMTHAGFMFPVAKGAKVDMIMRNSQSAQWLGLRWLYVSLSMISWTAGGELAFLLSSLLLLQFFRYIDQAPAGVQ